jgi:tetratricopeptide (TPR) repeat protein
MTTFWSLALSQVVYCKDSKSPPEVWGLDGDRVDAELFVRLGSLAQDWRSRVGHPADLLSQIRELTRKQRLVTLIQDALAHSECEFVSDIVEEVEFVLPSVASPKSIVSCVLEWPLSNPSATAQVMGIAMDKGCLATAALLSEVDQLQIPLKRLHSVWDSSLRDNPGEIGSNFDELWQPLVEAGLVVDLLAAATRKEFESSWASTMFLSTSPSVRAGYAKLGRALIAGLFPSGESDVRSILDLRREDDEAEREIHTGPSTPVSARHALFKVGKQIRAISSAVREVRDADARKYISEMVAEQLKYGNGSDYAVKSLCNIASQCRKMFREDIEGECLKAAVKIDPLDGWAQVQYANWLKDRGQFEEALRLLRDAKSLLPDSDTVAPASIADVYAAMGDWDAALDAYTKVPGYMSDLAVRHAMADVLRRRGDLHQAEEEYEWLLSQVLDQSMVLGSLAECAKLRGNLAKSAKLYISSLGPLRHWDETHVIGALGFASVLNRADAVDQALRVVEKVISIAPFSRQAYSLKARILSRLGRYHDAILALNEVGDAGGTAEWARSYSHGLALLGLREYAAAQARIEVALKQVSGDSSTISVVRMAAALAAIKQNQLGVAKIQLSDVDTGGDSLRRYMKMVLVAHLATLENDHEAVARLRSELIAMKPQAVNTDLVLKYLSQRNFAALEDFEYGVLLKLAA